MQIEGRTGVLWLALCFAVVSATGCSSSSEPGRGGGQLCTLDRECGPLGVCESGTCQLLGGAGGPPSLPAQGAMVESIQPALGSTSRCQATSPAFVVPANVDPVSGTAQTLMCDLTAGGCKPNENVVVDGGSANVQCTVSGGPDSFSVNAMLSQGSRFSVQGTIGPTGGKAFVSSNHAQFNLQDPSCDITIAPNQGEIILGAIWATFNCANFGDISTGDFSCAASGKFLFENCSK